MILFGYSCNRCLSTGQHRISSSKVQLLLLSYIHSPSVESLTPFVFGLVFTSFLSPQCAVGESAQTACNLCTKPPACCEAPRGLVSSAWAAFTDHLQWLLQMIRFNSDEKWLGAGSFWAPHHTGFYCTYHDGDLGSIVVPKYMKMGQKWMQTLVSLFFCQGKHGIWSFSLQCRADSLNNSHRWISTSLEYMHSKRPSS